MADVATDHPRMIATVDHVEPVPRRVRGVLAGATIVDTTRAVYVWEWENYPQFYIPAVDVAAGALVDEGVLRTTSRGPTRRHGVRVASTTRADAADLYGETAVSGLAGYVRFDWDALDAWFEEDEQVFVHPRSPYVRVDALRSSRRVRVELDGVELADSGAAIMVFETGLPTRYYLDRTCVNLAAFEATDTVTACPYKGRTSAYWSIRTPRGVHADLAWCYDFPTRELQPIAGLIAFYNEKVDISIDGTAIERPVTHFFD